MLRITLVLFIVSETVAQIDSTNKCPVVATVRNLDVVSFMGEWYQHAKYLLPFKVGKKCVTVFYQLQDDGTIMRKSSEVTDNNQSASVTAIAKISDKSNTGKWTIIYWSGLEVDSDYWILGTDYKNYAVVWSCKYAHQLSTQDPRILTRKRYPEPSVIRKAYEVVDKNKISRNYFRNTEQKKCPNAY